MRDLIYNGLAMAGSSLLSPESIHSAGSFLGDRAWRLLPKRRAHAIKTIAARLNVPREEAERLGRESTRSVARSFLEVFYTRRVDHRFLKEHVRIAEPELLDTLVASGAPIVGAVSHLGSWEFLAPIVSLTVPGRSKNVIMRRAKDEALNRIFIRQRSFAQVEVVEHRMAAFKVLKNLKRGGLSAFLVDHNCMRNEAIFLEFLGRVAAVNMGPAVLAVRAQAEVWPACLVRDPEPGRYTLHLSEPLRTAELTGSTEEKVQATASFYTQAVEAFVRRWPEQWFWLHKRWKTRPEGEGQGS